MLFRVPSLVGGRVWGQSAFSLQRRHASHAFRSGATSSTPFAKSGGGPAEGSVLGWQPSPKLMRNPVFRFLFHNAIPIATYQLVLEVGFTASFGIAIYSGRATGEGIVEQIRAWHYPFMSWITLEGCTYTEGIPVGPRTLKPEKLTAAHMGHNIASGLLPLQVVILMCTYPLILRARAMTAGGKAAAAAAAAAQHAGAAVRKQGAAASSAATVKETTNAAPKRRPSYVRPSTTHR